MESWAECQPEPRREPRHARGSRTEFHRYTTMPRPSERWWVDREGFHRRATSWRPQPGSVFAIDAVIRDARTGRVGVFSHETALQVHGLSDVLPAQLHLSVPPGWRSRRLRVPSAVTLHHSELGPADTAWRGAVNTAAHPAGVRSGGRGTGPPRRCREAVRCAGAGRPTGFAGHPGAR